MGKVTSLLFNMLSSTRGGNGIMGSWGPITVLTREKSDSIVLKQNHRISFAENKDSDTSKKKKIEKH